jgi:hypothetical protein
MLGLAIIVCVSGLGRLRQGMIIKLYKSSLI